MFGVKREIRRTVFFASLAVPSTYSGNSMATPSFGYGVSSAVNSDSAISTRL